MAIDNSGVVYVTDKYKFIVCSYSLLMDSSSRPLVVRGLNMVSFIIHSKLDSTNTVYITDKNHCVSVYTSSGQFIKCFGVQGRGEGELDHPRGVAVDNTTGALYVCDSENNRVVVY